MSNQTFTHDPADLIEYQSKRVSSKFNELQAKLKDRNNFVGEPSNEENEDVLTDLEAVEDNLNFALEALDRAYRYDRVK